MIDLGKLFQAERPLLNTSLSKFQFDIDDIPKK